MNNGISKITYAHDITLVTLSALPCDSKAIANVLTAMSNAEVNVDMISQTAPQGGTIRLSFSLSDSALSSALAVLGKIRGENPEVKPEILPGNCKVALYDANMVNTPGVAAKVFTLLAEAGIWQPSAEAAAAKVREVWDNPARWWLDERVQSARRAFCREHAFVDPKGPDAHIVSLLQRL